MNKNKVWSHPVITWNRYKQKDECFSVCLDNIKLFYLTNTHTFAKVKVKLLIKVDRKLCCFYNNSLSLETFHHQHTQKSLIPRPMKIQTFHFSLLTPDRSKILQHTCLLSCPVQLPAKAKIFVWNIHFSATLILDVVLKHLSNVRKWRKSKLIIGIVYLLNIYKFINKVLVFDDKGYKWGWLYLSSKSK